MMDGINGYIRAIQQISDNFYRMEQYFFRHVSLQRRRNAVNLSDAVFLVHHLLFQHIFYTNITVIDVFYISQLVIEIILYLRTFLPDISNLIAHVPYHKSQNKQLCHPNIGCIIKHNLKTASCIHLSEQISAYSKNSRKKCLMLSVHDSK